MYEAKKTFEVCYLPAILAGESKTVGSANCTSATCYYNFATDYSFNGVCNHTTWEEFEEESREWLDEYHIQDDSMYCGQDGATSPFGKVKYL